MNIFHSNTGTKPDRTRIYYQTDSSDTSISTDIGIEFINPTEISASYRSEIRSHGAQSESNQQYSETVREDMTITLYIDRSGEQSITGETGIKKDVDRIRSLIMPTIRGADHKKPPLCRIVTGSNVYRGSVSHLKEEYLFFNSSGFPVRVRLTLTLHAASTPETAEKAASPANSRKAWVIKSGDRLDMIANRFYGDPTLWRAIASENAIEDPLSFPLPSQIGQALVIPDKLIIR
ncbi:MAG: hypothetical protein F9K24_20385 [Leptonema illini]|uniref:LysM domain-containing protein n=1 Tax=Leptonema illini TaxID=183 RepID=A0A833GXQ0_9LEPT|nr:MAG: hypothetical protein F9K24_20385 [Leptonema illini]